MKIEKLFISLNSFFKKILAVKECLLFIHLPFLYFSPFILTNFISFYVSPQCVKVLLFPLTTPTV